MNTNCRPASNSHGDAVAMVVQRGSVTTQQTWETLLSLLLLAFSLVTVAALLQTEVLEHIAWHPTRTEWCACQAVCRTWRPTFQAHFSRACTWSPVVGSRDFPSWWRVLGTLYKNSILQRTWLFRSTSWSSWLPETDQRQQHPTYKI